MKVLGMDPSMTHWGYALGDLNLDTLEISVAKIWTTITQKGQAGKSVRVSADDLDRARTLAMALTPALKNVDMVFVEMPHGSQSAASQKSRAMVIGLLGTIDCPLVQLSEQELKIGTLGKKAATKQEMIDWAYAQHPHAGWKLRGGKPQANCEHEADAVGALHAGIKTDQFKQALAVLRYMRKAS